MSFCPFVRFSSCQACLKTCNPLISMKQTKSINSIPYDNVGWMGFVKRTIWDPMVKRNETKTGSLMFIDWWPCMHWEHRPTPNVQRRTVCRFFFFFSSRPELISWNRRLAFLKIPVHIDSCIVGRYIFLVGWVLRKRSMMYIGLWNKYILKWESKCCWFFWWSKENSSCIQILNTQTGTI